MVCRECGNPMRILKGGQKIIDGKIVNIQVMGCLNPNCKMLQIEQGRIVTETPEFQG